MFAAALTTVQLSKSKTPSTTLPERFAAHGAEAAPHGLELQDALKLRPQLWPRRSAAVADSNNRTARSLADGAAAAAGLRLRLGARSSRRLSAPGRRTAVQRPDIGHIFHDGLQPVDDGLHGRPLPRLAGPAALHQGPHAVRPLNRQLGARLHRKGTASGIDV